MYLSDSDIMKWNDRIPNDSKLFISSRYSNNSRHPTIIFSLKDSHMFSNSYDNYGNSKPREVGDPYFNYSFVFSVASNREYDFFKIFDKLSNEPFDNHILTANGTVVGLKLDKNITKDPLKSLHKVFNKEYTRFEYSFDGNLSSIMAYVCLLETSIEYFSLIWGYDEEGNEYNLLKYPIGNIVSPVDDKSKDYIILDYKYIRSGSEYKIYYITSEMFSDKNSLTIKYGPSKEFKEKDITWSRNGRIDDILN